MTPAIATLIFIGVAALLLLFLAMGVVNVYNHLVKLKNRYLNSFSQIEVQLKRRYDLIPNLVETTRSYLTHERETLEAVIQARNQASQGLAQAAQAPGNGNAMKALMGAESSLMGALGRLSVVMEDYPELKANETVATLTEELTSTENKIAFSRQAYNDSVTQYNIYRETFPTVVFAGMLGHAETAEMLEFADEAEIQNAPQVSLV